MTGDLAEYTCKWNTTTKYWVLPETFNPQIEQFDDWTNDPAQLTYFAELHNLLRYYEIDSLAPCLREKDSDWFDFILKDRDGNYFKLREDEGILFAWPKQIWDEYKSE